MGQPNTGPGQLIDTSGAQPYVPPPGAPPLLAGATPVAPPPAPVVYSDLGRGQAAADFASASAGAGWEYDPEAMEVVITNLDNSLKNDYQSALENATWLTQIKPMGDEVGSQGYVTAANNSGAAYTEFLQGAIDYTTAYVQTLKDIRTAYQNQDQASLEAIREAGKAV